LYQEALKMTGLKEQYIEGNRNNYLYYLACNCNRLGIPYKFAEKFIKNDFNSNINDSTIKTLKSGYSNKEEHNSIEKAKASVENYLQSKYDFRFNVFNGQIEYKRKPEKGYIFLNDYCLNSLIRELKANKLNMGREALDNRLKSDFTPKYHPLEEYISSLPKWDGKTDHITKLASKIKTDDDDFFKDAFKRWFVAM